MKKQPALLGGKLLLFCILFFQTFSSTAQIVARSVTSGTGTVVPFLLFKPSKHDQTPPTRKYPMIIFLHGGGESSTDTSLAPGSAVWALTGYGPLREIGWKPAFDFRWNGKNDTFIVIQPLCRVTSTWPTATVDAMINYGLNTLKADPNRIYLSGHSYGGAGVFNYLNSNSTNVGKLAAAVPIAAWNTALTTSGANLVSNAKLPVWAFKAQDDTNVSSDTTINSINRLNAVSPQVKPLFTFWPAGTILNHPHNDAHRYVYELHIHPTLEDGLINIYEWMLGQNNDSAANQLPVARAGNDTIIYTPSTTATLNAGASTDADGNIVRYRWRKIQGGSATITYDSAKITTVTGLSAGTYKFQLSVVDHRAGFTKDTVTVTVSNTPPPPTGKAVSFTSPTGRINAGNVTELVSAAAFTVEAQFKYDSTVSGWQTAVATIFRKQVSSTDRIIVQVDKATRAVYFYLGNGSSNTYGYTSSNVVSHNTWTHIAAVYDGAQSTNANRLKIYINGTLQTLTIPNTIPATTSSSTTSSFFGGEPSCCQTSLIDEVRLWDTVLAANTINSWKAKSLGSCHPNINALTVYWPLDNNTNPTSAVAALGTSYAGILVDANYVNSSLVLDTIACPSGKAVSLTTSSSRINAGNVTELLSSSAFTLETQFNYDATVSGFTTLFRKYTADNNKIMLHVGPGDNSIYFMVSNGSNTTYVYTDPNAVSPGTWNHVAAVFDGAQSVSSNRMKIYVNGVPQTLHVNGTLPASTSSTNTASLFIGGEPSCCQISTVDEVRVWDTVVSAVTINTWKNKLLGSCHPNVNHLTVYWPLNNDASATAATAELGTSYSGIIINGSYVGGGVAFAASDCGGSSLVLENASTLIAESSEPVEETQALAGRLYPNPSRGAVQLELNAPTSKSATILVIDMHGKYVYRKQARLLKGMNSLPVDISSLHSGIYLIEIRDGQTSLGKYKVVKR